jgi:DNA-binding transcriptional LysR family regulator
MELGDAQQFLEIVAAGSLSAAARRRGVAQSTLSRQLERLEHQLGTRLVERSTRAFRLTVAGEQFVAGAERLVRDAESLTKQVGEAARADHGSLRLSLCPALARRRLLAPTVAFFRERPQLRVQLRLEDDLVDLVRDRIDVAVRVGTLGDSELGCQRLGSYGHMLVAAPAYLRSAPPLRTPADIARHAVVGMRGAKAFTRWGFMLDGHRDVVEVAPSLETNDGEALRGLTVAGGGVTILPDYLAEEDLEAGRLVRLLGRWELSRVPIYAVYASKSGLSRAARGWISAIKAALSDPQANDS